jgi:hypothetical protein
MVHGLIGAPLAVAAIAGAGAMLPWLHNHFHRLTSWLIAIAAAMLALGVPEWTGALAGLAATGPGLTVLAVVTFGSGWVFWHHVVHNPKALERKRQRKIATAARRGKQPGGALALPGGAQGGAPGKDHHHRVWTNGIAAVFGTAVIITIGSLRLLAAAGGKTLAGTGTAMAQTSAGIDSGKAAASVPADHRMSIFITGVLILAAFIFALHSIEKRRKGGSRKRGQRQIPMGGGRSR